MSRPKSKAKPAASKEQVPAQDAKPTPSTEPEVPLDLLCDIAWRIARARGNSTIHIEDEAHGWAAWNDALRDAYRLIRSACVRRKVWHDRDQPDPHFVDAEKTIRSLATEDEYLDQHFEFGRGCQLITGIKKKAYAIALFRRACERGYLPIKQEQLKELEADGFFYDNDMIRLRVSFLRIPKPELRKNNSQKQSSKSFFE